MFKKGSSFGAENAKQLGSASLGYIPDRLATDLQTINIQNKSNVPVIQYGKNVPKKAPPRVVKTTNQKQINPTDQAYQAWIDQICKRNFQ